MKFLAILFLLLFFGMILVYAKVIEFPPRLGLEKVVQESLKGTKGEYAVAVKNLKTGESYFLNSQKKFDTGSLYKLWVMAEAYRQIEKGELKEDEVLSGGISDLNTTFEISSDSAELTTGSISLPVRFALKQMITISHNYAALLLAERVRHSRINKLLDDYGLNSSSLGVGNEAPASTAADMLKFFEKLYMGELGNTISTKKMLDLLKDQRLNKKLPRYFPENVEIAHKTGEIDYFSHDAGIVFTKKGDYAIVVLSKTINPPAAEERIGRISKGVYDYFQKQNLLPRL